jgi:hypothetical protein
MTEYPVCAYQRMYGRYLKYLNISHQYLNNISLWQTS